MAEKEAQVLHRFPQSPRKQEGSNPALHGSLQRGGHQGGACGLDGGRAQEVGTNNPEIIKSATRQNECMSVSLECGGRRAFKYCLRGGEWN